MGSFPSSLPAFRRPRGSDMVKVAIAQGGDQLAAKARQKPPPKKPPNFPRCAWSCCLPPIPAPTAATQGPLGETPANRHDRQGDQRAARAAPLDRPSTCQRSKIPGLRSVGYSQNKRTATQGSIDHPPSRSGPHRSDRGQGNRQGKPAETAPWPQPPDCGAGFEQGLALIEKLSVLSRNT